MVDDDQAAQVNKCIMPETPSMFGPTGAKTGFGSMEPSSFGCIGEHLQEHEQGNGYRQWFDASSSCLALMASVTPQDGLSQHSSLSSWFNHVSSSSQYQYFTPSTNSNVDQSISMDCSRNYKEVRPANDSDTDPEKLTMPHFEQQIASGYSSSEDDQRERDETCLLTLVHLGI